MDKELYIGYVTGAFGINGEIKIFTESNHLDLIFKENSNLIIDNKKYTIKKYRFHKNNYLVTFDGLDSIDKVESLFKKEVFVNKKDLNLKENEYLYIELINLEIKENGKTLGIVEELLYNKTNLFIKCGDLILPVNDRYIKIVDINNNIIIVENSEELRL